MTVEGETDNPPPERSKCVVRDIVEQIWQLPWYQVLVIAIVDDIILLAKIWPAWVVIMILSLVIGWISERSR
jgi:hypothetical protein